MLINDVDENKHTLKCVHVDTLRYQIETEFKSGCFFDDLPAHVYDTNPISD